MTIKDVVWFNLQHMVILQFPRDQVEGKVFTVFVWCAAGEGNVSSALVGNQTYQSRQYKGQHLA